MITIKKRRLTQLTIQPVIYCCCIWCEVSVPVYEMYLDFCYDCYALYMLSNKQGFLDEDDMDIDCTLKRTFNTDDFEKMQE